MADIIVSPRAADDADGIFLYLARQSRSAADRFIERLDAAFARLSADPLIGAPRVDLHPEARILVFDRYLVVHRLRAGVVEIITLFDGRRDPATLDAILGKGRSPSGR